jgi:uncharacterized oxidoreductase
MPTFNAEPLEQLAVAIFERCGAPADHAQCVASHLVEANLAGHDSHGVLRIAQYVDLIDAGTLKPAAQMQIVHETAAAAVVDGNAGFGQVIARDAMRLAIKIARREGVGAVTVRHCSHTGRIGTYTQMAAEEGLVGIAMVNTGGGGQSVAPFGGTARRLSTNPISIAAPSAGPRPIVLDMATSVAPEGKVRARYQAQTSLPPGWMIDAQGQPTTNPANFYQEPLGALLPLGGALGYKGFGLAFAIDMLAGGLSGAGCCQPNVPVVTDGMLAIALDVGQFTPLAEFTERVAALTEHIKSSPTAAGYDEIFVPGEVEARTREQRLAAGISIPPGTWELIDRIRARFGIDEVAPR